MILEFPLQSQSCFAFLFFVASLIKPFVNLLCGADDGARFRNATVEELNVTNYTTSAYF